MVIDAAVGVALLGGGAVGVKYFAELAIVGGREAIAKRGGANLGKGDECGADYALRCPIPYFRRIVMG